MRRGSAVNCYVSLRSELLVVNSAAGKTLHPFLVFALVMWLALVCGGLVTFGVLSLLGAFGALGIGDPGVSVALRLISGLLFLGLAAVAFVALLYVVGGRRVATQSQPQRRAEFSALGLQLDAGWFAALAGVHYRGVDASGRRADLYLRDLRRRSSGSGSRFMGVRLELFVAADLATRAVVARPRGTMAAALVRLNRRFGLLPVEGFAMEDTGRSVWARDPAWMRRLLNRPTVAAALEELVPAEPSSDSGLIDAVVHVQPRAVYWTARLSSQQAVDGAVQRGLEVLGSFATVAEEMPRPSSLVTERAMERRSRVARGSIAVWTVGGCLVVFALLLAVPFLLLLTVSLAARLG